MAKVSAVVLLGRVQRLIRGPTRWTGGSVFAMVLFDGRSVHALSVSLGSRGVAYLRAFPGLSQKPLAHNDFFVIRPLVVLFWPKLSIASHTDTDNNTRCTVCY